MDRGERLCPCDEGSREPPPSVVAPFSDVQIDRPMKQTDRDNNATFTTVCYHASARISMYTYSSIASRDCHRLNEWTVPSKASYPH